MGEAFLSICVLSAIGMGIFYGGAYREHNALMQEAFDRGYAVQCIGKTGYYWECDE